MGNPSEVCEHSDGLWLLPAHSEGVNIAKKTAASVSIFVQSTQLMLVKTTFLVYFSRELFLTLGKKMSL